LADPVMAQSRGIGERNFVKINRNLRMLWYIWLLPLFQLATCSRFNSPRRQLAYILVSVQFGERVHRGPT